MDLMITMSDGSEFIAHHGILGQKWGVRRYQNKDGSLTDAGKRRLAKLEKKRLSIEQDIEPLVRKKDGKSSDGESKNDSPPKPKRSVFEMTNDELRSEIERLGLQKQYKQYLSEMYPTPKRESYFNGKKIVGEALSRGLTNAGAKVVETGTGIAANKIAKELGLDVKLYPLKDDDDKKKK